MLAMVRCRLRFASLSCEEFGKIARIRFLFSLFVATVLFTTMFSC